MDAARAEAPALHALPTVSIDAAADWALLDAQEQARARRFVHPHDATAYVATHAALRRLLAPAAPAALRFAIGAHGKPSVAAGAEPGVHFSLSHTRGHAWAATCAHAPVGLDIEWPAPMPDAETVAATVMCAREHAAWLALPPSDRLIALLRLWTRKEAALKCLGVGLSRAPATLSTGWEDSGTVEGLALQTAFYNGLILSWAAAPVTPAP